MTATGRIKCEVKYLNMKYSFKKYSFLRLLPLPQTQTKQRQLFYLKKKINKQIFSLSSISFVKLMILFYKKLRTSKRYSKKV